MAISIVREYVVLFLEVQDAPETVFRVGCCEIKETHILIILAVEGGVILIGGLSYLEERQTNNSDTQLEQANLKLELFLVQGLASDQSFLDCV